jgi:hypothetical protein
VYKKLSKLLRIACKFNKKQKTWQTTPFHIANCLHRLYKGYPAPSMAGNNALDD